MRDARYLVCSLAVAGAVGLLSPLAVQAQSAAFIRECQQWIDKKGYSTDYIEQKLGKRQPGMASAWRGNVPVEEVRPGDVALVGIRTRPDSQHVALVEEVHRGRDGLVTAVRVSEWNWGRYVDQGCLVTETFGRLAPERKIHLDAIRQVWRPDR